MSNWQKTKWQKKFKRAIDRKCRNGELAENQTAEKFKRQNWQKIKLQKNLKWHKIKL